MARKKCQVPCDAPLNSLDTEDQTYGCRQAKPRICKNYLMDGVCAFCRDDDICKKPPRTWKNQYLKLKSK